MRGAGIKLPITVNSPASAHLLDITRTVSRAGQHPTGIDRIERAYIAHLSAAETPLFGLVRTKLGYLLIDRSGCETLLKHCSQPVWSNRDFLSRLTRRTDQSRATVETGLRQIAVGRATPSRLTRMLGKHIPNRFVYFNVGQSNFNDRVIQAVRTCEGARTVAYLHDTIPLDWPDMQTQTSILRFRRMFDRVDRFADLVLCNSMATKADIVRHAKRKHPEEIEVIPPGLPDMRLGSAPQGPWGSKPYFVAVGTIEPRKKIDFLLELWEDFASDDAPHLILCGRRGWRNEAVFRRLDAKPARVHELSGLNDGDMWALLSASNGVLFPSVAEGFGYPAIEAAHLNVPLICNPLAVFKDVLGDYPIYADVSDRYLWRNKIEQLAQRRRGQSGEQYRNGAFDAPNWQAHFNRLFTVL